MKNMKKFIKQNIKGFIVGLIVTGIGIVTASTIMPSNSVTYNNSSQNVTNVKEALDVLLEKSKCEYKPGDIVQTFNYTGKIEEIKLLCSGTYKLEVYGSEAGGSGNGKGGYSVGTINLNKDEMLYIGVGGKNGYNGGGSAAGSASSGGGATHIAESPGLLKDLSNNKSSVLIVAGGGGGGASYGSAICSGGNGGGPSGNGGGVAYVGGNSGAGGNQTAGGGGSNHAGSGSFGKGGNGAAGGYSGGGGGGGGGWYGGGGGSGYGNTTSDDWHQFGSGGQAGGGGGGSGYIGGVNNGSMTSGTRIGDGMAQITFVSF